MTASEGPETLKNTFETLPCESAFATLPTDLNRVAESTWEVSFEML